MNKEKIRKFETGATRNVDDHKVDYFGFICPEAMHRYAEYMHTKRVQADGTLRDSDNWKKGIDKDVYIRSLLRHVWDLWRLHLGFKPTDPDSGEPCDYENLLCAILFNAQGYLHELVKEKNKKKNITELLNKTGMYESDGNLKQQFRGEK